MFNRKLALALVVILSLVFSGVAMAAVPITGTESAPVSTGGVTPYIIPGENEGGNRTCEEVGMAFFADANYYAFSSERINRDDEDNSFDPAFPEGITVEYDTDLKLLSFESEFGIGAVIMKGGQSGANVYVYEPQVTSDSGLGAPPPADLSNITFCWNPDPVEECWDDETAWADGPRYNTERGNWATYTPYNGEYMSVTLFAGQDMEAGTVEFSAPEDGVVTITITLNDGWRFYDDPDMENVKIQDYEFAPSGNPSPGGFDYKGYATGSSFSIEVSANNFYGVHVDVEQRVDCPVE